jgi:hypothetical protein
MHLRAIDPRSFAGYAVLIPCAANLPQRTLMTRQVPEIFIAG